ncbi:MAG TPA: 4,5-DOPA dioxygenase extradiol [Chloroflexi bacterium]|nr:4,5-DOPA dioxygenase extradiol [Chloroflexota bacterium]
MTQPLSTSLDETPTMPTVFVGHGSPMNAIEDNEFSLRWQELGKSLPRPKAILCISAHWQTWGTFVTDMERPRTIHDFGGFPQTLYQVQYPAPGSQWLTETIEKVSNKTIKLDQKWGLDHGCWSVLKHMYPEADIPVVQLSLDYAKQPHEHYTLGRELFSLRQQNVLILGSGNLVHNLNRVVLKGNSWHDFNKPFGLDWAIEANELFKKLIDDDRHKELINYPKLGAAVELAVPTPEHYLPALYILALKEASEQVAYFNDSPVAGSLTMTSFVIQ